jgi:hypothetical protein
MYVFAQIGVLSLNEIASDVFVRLDKDLPSISRGLKHMNERAQAVSARVLYESQSNVLRNDRRASSTSNRSDTVAESALEFPLDNIPYPRNRLFCGRIEVLAQLEASLVPHEEPQEVSCQLLSGTAGIGKTQLALHYAISRKELAQSGDPRGEGVILWIKCETSLQLAQSLLEVVTLLKLVDPEESVDVERCRLVLFRWLSAVGELKIGNRRRYLC